MGTLPSPKQPAMTASNELWMPATSVAANMSANAQAAGCSDAVLGGMLGGGTLGGGAIGSNAEAPLMDSPETCRSAGL
jgi:hypothetical protein